MGRCYSFKISPTVSLDSQSSQRGATATAANLTLCTCGQLYGLQARRFIDFTLAPAPTCGKISSDFKTMQADYKTTSLELMAGCWISPPKYENSI